MGSMLNLPGNGGVKTMSSQEIAGLTGKEHKNVTRDINKMFVELGEDALKFERIYFDSMNRPQVEYVLDRELTDTLLTGYSALARRKVIARWHELEAAAPPAPDLSDPHALRGLLLQYSEKVIELDAKIAADAPKVRFAEIIRAVDGVCHIGEFCKTLKIGRNKMFRLLKADKILMGSRMPYQKYIDKGYFSVIEQKPYTNSKGETHVTFTTMVTGAGQVFLAKRYANLVGGGHA
jgi:anti-repressor protein